MLFVLLRHDLPASQVTQLPCLTAFVYVPSGQAWGAVDPTVGHLCPTGQSMHTPLAKGAYSPMIRTKIREIKSKLYYILLYFLK